MLAFTGCGGKTASNDPEIKKLIQDMPPEQRTALQTDFLAKALSLTPEQSYHIDQINKKYARRVDSILYSDDWRSAKARKFKAAMKSKESEIKRVLTKDQYKKYEQIREEIRQDLRNRR